MPDPNGVEYGWGNYGTRDQTGAWEYLLGTWYSLLSEFLSWPFLLYYEEYISIKA
jgi:hypothetical protein